MHCALWDISKYPAVTENVITLLKQEKALLFNTLQQNRTVGIKPRKETIMKARKPSGQILIIFETDLSEEGFYLLVEGSSTDHDLSKITTEGR